MGYESCLLINHDQYHEMADNPVKFVRDIWHAINATGNPTKFATGLVVYTDHSAACHLVAVGGHLGVDLGLVSDDRNPLKPETQLKLLEQAADKLGYKLEPKVKRTRTKAPVKKTTTKKATTKKVAKKKTAKKASSSRKGTDGKTPAKGNKRTRKGTSGG